MRKFLTLWRREVQSCFLASVAYVTLVVFIMATGVTFWVAAFRNIGRPEPLSLLLIGSLMVWTPILVTVVAMRLFVDEKRQGTLETLLTAPVTETQVVLGKYAGALTFLALAVAPCFLFPFILERLSPTLTLATLDLGALLGAGLIMALVLAAMLALALPVSLTTRNHIVAAISIFAALCLALLGGWLLESVPGLPRGLVASLSLTRHLEDVGRGVIDAPVPVFYLSVTGLCLFAAIRMLEARQWK